MTITVQPSTPTDGVECYWLTTGDQFDGVATVYGPQNETNERLAHTMAAAPDLLKAAELCLKAERSRRKKLLPGAPATTYCEHRIALIERAIAKARGDQ